MDASRIDYAPPIPVMERRRTRRWTIGALLLVAGAFALWLAGPAALTRVQILYWQHRALNYLPAADEVVYEDDPAQLTRLRAADKRLSAGANGSAFLFAEPWDRLYSLMSPPGAVPAATLFLHERVNSHGERRLVVIQEQFASWYLFGSSYPGGSPRRPTDPFVLGWTVITPGSWFSGARQLPQSFQISVPDRLFLQPTYFRWYAGQPDPRDASHFTLRGTMNGRPITVEGWLGDDDTVRFELPR